jgi:predicted transcriptional regulator of viral defense system
MSVNKRVVALADLAAGQWGLFATAQARDLGFSAVQLTRLADDAVIERLRHGVYRIAGAPSTPQDQVRAAWLAIEPQKSVEERLKSERPAVVSHRSAARIHRLGDVEADVIEFTVQHRKQTRLADIRYHRALLSAHEWTLVDGLPTTTVLKTIEDLAADQLDGGHLASVIRDAVITDRVSSTDVAQILRPYAHKYGARLGDGEALLDRFLQQAGVPDSTRALTDRLRSPVPPGFAAALAKPWAAGLPDNGAIARAFPQIAAESPALRAAMNHLAETSSTQVFSDALRGLNEAASARIRGSVTGWQEADKEGSMSPRRSSTGAVAADDQDDDANYRPERSAR